MTTFKEEMITAVANTAAIMLVVAIPASFIWALWSGEWRWLLITAVGVAIARECMKP